MLEGEVGFEIGDEVRTARPGSSSKPRGIRHAFWNATDEPARMLELISPPGSSATSPSWPSCSRPPSRSRISPGSRALQERYGLEMDFGSIERLSREHGLGSP